MKSIKYLLAAFVVSAMFASCAKEEITIAPENQIEGAELLGTNISVNFGKDISAGTKITEKAEWESTDKLGFGWLQAGTTPTDEIHLNHMFQLNDEGTDMVTKGNVYAGWHFGYYPFVYQSIPGEKLSVNINPAQTSPAKEGELTESYNSGLWLTGTKSLTAANDLDANYQLTTTFKMFQVTKSLMVTIKPDDVIKNDAILKDLDIKSITICTPNKGIFVNGNVTVNASNLSELVYTEGKYDAVKTKKAFYDNLVARAKESNDDDKLLVYSKSISATVAVDNDDMNLSSNQTLRVNTMPRHIDMDDANKLDYYFLINVEGGYFKVKYTNKAEKDLKEYEKINNAAFVKLIKAFSESTGAMASFNTNANGEHRPGISLVLDLNHKLFTPDFDNIASEAEWNKAVKIANTLEIPNPKFTIIRKDGKVWRFKDEDKDGNLINMPNNKLIVETNGSNMALGAEGVWPSESFKAVNARVVVEKDLTVEGSMIASEIINKATIYAGANSSISTKDAKKLDNTEGRVIVEYGAYVYPADNKKGTIAYVVENAEPANIVRINRLLTSTTLGIANVNTLIVKDTELDLNAPAVAAADTDDRYEDTSIDAKAMESLSDVNIELENGSLAHTIVGPNSAVKHLIAVSGENSIDDIVVNEHIETLKGATLNVNNTVVTEISKPYFVQELVNEGTLNSNVATLNVNKVDNATGNINVASNCYIYYTDEYIQGGAVKGWILKAGATSLAPGETVPASDLYFDGNNYTVYTAKGMLALAQNKLTAPGIVITLGADIDMSGVNWTGINHWNAENKATFDGKGHTIKNLTGSQGLIKAGVMDIKNLTLDGASIYSSASHVSVVAGQLYGDVENVTVKNSGIAADVTKNCIRYGAIVGQHNSGNVKKCTVENFVISGAYHNIGGISGQVNETNNREYSECVVKNTSLSSRIDHELVGAITGSANGVDLTIKKCTITGTTPSKLYGGVLGTNKVTIVK